MRFYTTAPTSYDLDDTTVLDPRIGEVRGGQDAGARVRLVQADYYHTEEQSARYRAGFYVHFSMAEFAQAIASPRFIFLDPENFLWIYTDAPQAYDWDGYTIEVSQCVAKTRRKNVDVRLVLIRKEYAEIQQARYSSGLHMSLPLALFRLELANEQHGLVVPV